LRVVTAPTAARAPTGMCCILHAACLLGAASVAGMSAAQECDYDDAGGQLGRFVRNLEYLRKWLLLGVVIGVIAGLGAITFYLALKYTGEFLLGYLASYHVPTPLVEGGDTGSSRYARPWAIPLVTTAGALAAALIVARFAPEATGHGTDSAIEAVHTDPRHIRGRVVLVKMVASALTIGSGGSGGREGPTAQISAGFGSLLTRRLNLSDADGRILVSLGVGAGIGAIFGAPLGGAVLAAGIVYRDDFDYATLYPGFVTSATAYAVFGSFLGFDPMFGYVDAEYCFEGAWPLLWLSCWASSRQVSATCTPASSMAP
jgi:chloride channel protein, CIC family